MVIEKANW